MRRVILRFHPECEAFAREHARRVREATEDPHEFRLEPDPNYPSPAEAGVYVDYVIEDTGEVIATVRAVNRKPFSQNPNRGEPTGRQ